MKKSIYIFGLFLLLLSCKEEETDQSGEDTFQEQVNNLQNAYNSQKKIVSAISETVNNVDCWIITFSDNAKIQLPKSAVESLSLDENMEECTIKLLDGRILVFNRREIIYPTGIVILTQDIKFMKNTEVPVEFRVNPSNAIFNYDVLSENCQIHFDMVGKVNTYSYVTKPENCRLTRIEQVKGDDGKIKEGQYKAYIRDNGEFDAYKYTTALVLSTIDKNGDNILLSSSAISLERKKDTALPVVVINTENNAEIKDKENWISAQMTIDGIGKFDNYEGTTSIRGRGNSTWGYPKKPFALKLDTKSEILGMPSHKRWVLLANYMDRTLIRNHIAFEIAKITDLEWTPRGQFVEVVLNDVHLGNYYLCEHIKIDENRVNIVEMKSTDLDEESITGGYLLEMDTYYDEVNKFKTAICDLPVMFKEPEEDVLQPKQFEYIQNYINSFEQALYSEDFAKTREYVSYISDTTFVDWWIVMELTHNHEAKHPRSSYIYKNRSELLKAGPVWDFDWGTFKYISSGFCAKDAIWYSQLFKDPVFVNTVKTRWAKFKPLFENIALAIEQQRDDLSVSAELNDEMWSLHNSPVINEDESLSYRDALILMRTNYEYRLNWLDEQIRQLK